MPPHSRIQEIFWDLLDIFSTHYTRLCPMMTSSFKKHPIQKTPPACRCVCQKFFDISGKNTWWFLDSAGTWESITLWHILFYPTRNEIITKDRCGDFFFTFCYKFIVCFMLSLQCADRNRNRRVQRRSSSVCMEIHQLCSVCYSSRFWVFAWHIRRTCSHIKDVVYTWKHINCVLYFIPRAILGLHTTHRESGSRNRNTCFRLEHGSLSPHTLRICVYTNIRIHTNECIYT